MFNQGQVTCVLVVRGLLTTNYLTLWWVGVGETEDWEEYEE
jgi:hypothetical protein